MHGKIRFLCLRYVKPCKKPSPLVAKLHFRIYSFTDSVHWFNRWWIVAADCGRFIRSRFSVCYNRKICRFQTRHTIPWLTEPWSGTMIDWRVQLITRHVIVFIYWFSCASYRNFVVEKTFSTLFSYEKYDFFSILTRNQCNINREILNLLYMQSKRCVSVL